MSEAAALVKNHNTSSNKLSFQEVLITPDMAEEWLKGNAANRRLAKTTVNAYVRDMIAGNWRLSGDPIRFDSDGKLIDGQHRLKACTIARVPFRSVVIRNMPYDVMRVIDHGRSRTVADNLHIEGKQHSLILAAAARWLYVFKHGASVIGKGRITATEILEMVDKHPMLQSSVMSAYKCAGVTPSLLSAVHYVAYNLVGKDELADEFANVFVSGISYYEDDAAHCWRERLIRMRDQRSRVVMDQLHKGTIHAWNNFSERVPVKMARIPDVAAFVGLDYKLL
jgi:hypothetical protein